MVHAPDHILASGFVIDDFPTDRAASPAWLTIPASKIYGWCAASYHKWYGQRVPYRLNVPVISVGNIVVGGTGKTPTVIALAKLLRERFSYLRNANAVAILSRGYGRRSKELVVVESDSDWRETGDEPLLIKRAVPEVAVVVHADRRLAADHAGRVLQSKLLLLDDGFQHRRISRDLDLVLVDGEHPLGNGYLLPAGPLREPAQNLDRASALFGVGELRSAASELAVKHNKDFFTAIPQLKLPPALADGSIRRVYAFAGIARPHRFRNSLINNSLEIIGARFFRDHHAFRLQELESIAIEAVAQGAEAVVTTEKDRVRIGAWDYPVPLLVVGLEMCFNEPNRVYEMLTSIVQKT